MQLEEVEVAVVRDEGLDVAPRREEAHGGRRVVPPHLLRAWRRPLVRVAPRQLRDRCGGEARVALKDGRLREALLKLRRKLAHKQVAEVGTLAVHHPLASADAMLIVGDEPRRLSAAGHRDAQHGGEQRAAPAGGCHIEE